MIGGNDVIIPAIGDSASLEACARIVLRQWPSVRFEDAITGDKYPSLWDIPFGNIRELLAYPDADAEAAWDADSADSAENSMLNVIVSRDNITLVLDNADTADMRSIVEAIRGILRSDILYKYAEAA